MKKRSFIVLGLGLGTIIIFVLVVNLVISIQTKPYIFETVDGAPQAKTIIILGAAVSPNGALSSIFKDRVDTAIQLYKEGKSFKILVSGDNSTKSYNEVSPVRNYLLENGILDQDIFLDHAGFDTYSTMYRARDIFRVTSTLVVTQSFHLPRAVFIARKLGLNAYGVAVHSQHLSIRNYIREVFASEKAVLNLLLHRKPKYLGSEIPII